AVVLVAFFFQAEDGIRDFHVTGVQTCALPIWRRTGCRSAPPAAGGCNCCRSHPPAGCANGYGYPPGRQTRAGRSCRPLPLRGLRSEERRVGKECSSRGSPNQLIISTVA